MHRILPTNCVNSIRDRVGRQMQTVSADRKEASVSSYVELNDFVNQTFFDGKNESRPVYLSLEDNDREKLAGLMGVTTDELDVEIGSVVRETLDFSGSNVYRQHIISFKEWQERDFDTDPPFSALLLALTLAAERMRSEGDYSANNYYQRLFEVLSIADEEQQKSIRRSRKHTRTLWWALNLWLTEYDYALGKPTARQVNSWTYVSYALSQSLVRLADRLKFHDLYAEFGLSPNDRLSESEMMLYLHEWMSGHGPSRWLKRLWASPDLRERVAAAAVDELDNWDGRSAAEGEGRATRRRLGWAAVVKRFPRKRFDFYLARSAIEDDATGKLSPIDDAPRLAREAIGDADALWFEELRGTSLEYLAPLECLKLGALFLTPIELQGEGTQETYRHESRPVIPLVKDEAGPYYREVARTSLHTSHLVLCHSKWVPSIDSHLKSHARQGYECVAGDNSNGIPEGWNLFLNVEILTIPSGEVNNNLQSLVPLSTGATIQLEGGLKLAHNIWHASSPPEVLASNEDGILEVQLRVDDLSQRKKILAKTTPQDYDTMFIKDSGVELDSQNLKVVGIKNKRTAVERTIAFRSARTPRRKANLESNYVYKLEPAAGLSWGFSAIPEADVDDRAVALRGMIVTGELKELPEIAVPALQRSIGAEYAIDEEAGYNMQSVEGMEATCILRGHHYFICAPQQSFDREETSRKMHCKDCSNVQIADKPRRGRRKKRKKKTTRVKEAPRPASVSGQVEQTISADSVFDAVCYLGSGTWASLEPVLSSLVSAPWEVSIVGSNLVDLGLIDIELDSASRRPSHWSCPPPTLVVTGHGTAFLSGFRDISLLKEIKANLDPISLGHRVVQQRLAPLAHVWTLGQAGIDEVREALSVVEGPLGRPIEIVLSPALAIVNQMPSIAEIEAGLHQIEIDSRDDIERFDPRTGRWQKSAIDRPGSYRASFRGRRCFHRLKDGTMREAGFELAKLLAARDEGISIHGYDSEKETFECVIGCQPPGLYRRALVACSGFQCLESDGRLIYKHVPPDVANLILTKLYEEDGDA